MGVSGGVFTFSSEFGEANKGKGGGSVAKFRCGLCGSEQFTSQGALNLHKYHCENKKYRNKFNAETCAHDWRLLNPHNEIERKAMGENYMEVCNKCQTLQ